MTAEQPKGHPVNSTQQPDPWQRIETDEGLQAVPHGTVVRGRDGTIAGRYDETRGVVLGDERTFEWSAIKAPAIVLWTPGDERRVQR